MSGIEIVINTNTSYTFREKKPKFLFEPHCGVLRNCIMRIIKNRLIMLSTQNLVYYIQNF